MEPGLTCVITTIQEPTASVLGIMRALSRRSPAGKLIAIGDQKGPRQFDLPNADFYSLDRQRELPFSLAGLLPTKHYARKNLGYLIAMKEGAPVIYETDDDNAPLDAWKPLPRTAQAIRIGGQRWFNVYRLFSDELIWPRGMPLDRVRDAGTYSYDASTKATAIDSPIHQGLADLAPDVDAVWRLILDHDFTFRPGPSILLDPGTWCPFNSQNTWWWPAAYQLMYLPSYCSFRMTDIWRSFIAQRCLWETGAGVVFHQADVEQQRNAHNLMRDFMDEVPGYEGNQRLIDVLRETKLQGGPAN
ncbi:MAG TPA: STELLO glycosyltransferase family protein, partial [Tepidisphaeraceae bacterium]|nr:STELLO glycosyltransferase family protein [Tepidisphaeraceae bacterium]